MYLPYAKGEYYVEGVGKEIKLIKEDSLDVPTTFTTNIVNLPRSQFDFHHLDKA